MKLPMFDFIRPTSIEEASSLLEEHAGKAVLLAGGTTLLITLRYRLKKPSLVIGLKGLKALDSIVQDAKGGVSIGSMVTLEALSTSPLMLKEYPSLVRTIQLIAVPPIRNQATIGGNLCLDTRCLYYNQSESWRDGQEDCFKLGGNRCNAVEKGRRCQAVYQGDLAPLLLAMGAEVKIVSKNSEKVIPLSQFFTGRGERPNILKPNEMLAEIRIPPPDHETVWVYEKLRVREGMDFPMAAAAVMLKRDRNGTVEQAKLVLGAVGSSPTEVTAAQQILQGHKATQDLIHTLSREAMERSHPVGNLVMDTGYRKKMVGVLVRRALNRALMMSQEIRPQ